ncbi:MAG: 3-phosphoserine/phosphohydroxythreonine transaminase [Myxococcales bacterium]|nr:3-phosphoserine/phosphohydroxythreonine transaminase [Myxococcales bacterium]
MSRSDVVNFSAGPAALPAVVLERAREELLDYRGTGASILEQSHRAPPYDEIHHDARARLARLLSLPDSHTVLFLQGGASTLFATVPLNFLYPNKSADYVLTGVWSEKALSEALLVGEARIAATGHDGHRWVSCPLVVDADPQAAYVHMTTNNTIIGAQFHRIPDVGGVPLVADMSSDLLSRPLDMGRFHLAYAGAQKNLGPSGVTVVIARADWLEAAREDIPKILRFQTHADAQSLYHTPPTFAVYLLRYVLEWIEAEGGAEGMERRNREKQARLYGAIDAHPALYSTHVERDARSWMNVVFHLPNEALEERFLAGAEERGLHGLRGHRTFKGVRASLYNAIELAQVDRLVEWMNDFGRIAA